MSEEAPAVAAEEAPAPATSEEVEGAEALGDPGKKALDSMKAREKEARAEARAAKAELEKLRQSSMTEAEKASAEAEARGRAAATTEFGQRLATSRFDALASKRNPGFDTSAFLEIVDLKKFVGDDGEPDEKAIAAAVEKHVPAAEAGVPSFDGGTRTTPPAPAGMNALIRQRAGRA